MSHHEAEDEVPRLTYHRDEVLISIQGGLADVLYVPEGVQVTICDLDVDQYEETDSKWLRRLPDGSLCVVDLIEGTGSNYADLIPRPEKNPR